MASAIGVQLQIEGVNYDGKGITFFFFSPRKLKRLCTSKSERCIFNLPCSMTIRNCYSSWKSNVYSEYAMKILALILCIKPYKLISLAQSLFIANDFHFLGEEEQE
ncbi:hypothetical protein KIL84_013317 [Mauremys mutica]|uniref:Uncharacterized protein n=1 Tax=Mauremys mutica TaxID=74926 RepID=A0A9D3WVB2_9SAUR|nr:hypothetical protein KIL84_013317 [Mauremys mutica]